MFKRFVVFPVFVAALLAFVTVPAKAVPQRIADAWYAHNAMLVMLGAQDRIVATVARPSVVPWMFRLVPGLARAQRLQAGALNGEDLLKLGVDLVFVPQSDRSGDGLQQVGLNVVSEGFTSFDGLLDCVDSTAATLQTPLAARRAQAYRIAFLDAISNDGTNAAGPRLLHVASLSPLRVDGDGTIIDAWIRSAGGRNAADGVHGNKQPVSVEQVLAWNPDIVIVGASAGDVSGLGADPLWLRVQAVRAGKVFRNPAGLFPWDRYGPELLLQLEWARQIVTHGSVDEMTMSQKIRQFYINFYGITLSQNDAVRILDGLAPQ